MIDAMALGRPAVVAAYVIRGKEVSSAGTVLKDLKKIGLTGECVDYLSLHIQRAYATSSIQVSYGRKRENCLTTNS